MYNIDVSKSGNLLVEIVQEVPNVKKKLSITNFKKENGVKNFQGILTFQILGEDEILTNSNYSLDLTIEEGFVFGKIIVDTDITQRTIEMGKDGMMISPDDSINLDDRSMFEMCALEVSNMLSNNADE